MRCASRNETVRGKTDEEERGGEGDETAARQLYQEIADDLTAPPGVRARAAQVLASLGPGPAE